MTLNHSLESIDLGDGWFQILVENFQLQPHITTTVQEEVLSLSAKRLACFHTSNDILGKASHSKRETVNALLTYSRGQLALAPCYECSRSYSMYGSAMPFPDCVFLPNFWGFACASCIARHRASECSFQFRRNAERDKMWEELQVRSDDIGTTSMKWLERGHPLLKFDPNSPCIIWIRRRHSQFPHDVRQPLQEPSFVYPPDNLSVRLPDHTPPINPPQGDLCLLRDKLSIKRNIVVISGAGVSTNAGIADFQSVSGTKASSRNLFNSSAYTTCESADELHTVLLGMLQSGEEAAFTPFDEFVDKLAQSGQLRRHYTQNIDCRQDRLPHLSQKTIWLHGRTDTLVCHMRPSHTKRVTAQSFSQWVMAVCSDCEAEERERTRRGMRSRRLGFLRPKVLLYGEDCVDEFSTTSAFNSDLLQPIDAILIVGTRLQIRSLRQFVEQLCKAARAHSPESLVIWVSKDPPKLGKQFSALIDFEFLGDCDKFASIMSEKSGEGMTI